jgi:ribonuclease VapC
MYIETSAIVAILTEEPDAVELLSRLEASNAPFTSIVSKVEAALAIGKAMGNFRRSAELVEEFLDRLGVRTDAVSPDLYWEIMRTAASYGKGSGHAAKLNFGDCFSYAMAKRADGGLLYKGNDFAQTELG